MRILLLGEFSGLHNHLRDGLIELGHEVVLAGRQDGFKKFPVDINLEPRFLPKKIGLRLSPLKALSMFKNFDVVQIVNPFIFPRTYFPSKWFYRYLAENNNKLFLLAAGDDAYYWTAGPKILRYGPFEAHKKFDLHGKNPVFLSAEAMDLNSFLIEISHGIIPTAAEYELVYESEKKCRKTIPLPFNSDDVDFVENVPGKKLSFHHGVNRYGFKGTFLIEEAFDVITSKYPNDVRALISPRMSISKYLKLLANINVSVDQTFSYSWGYNALNAMAMGRVVLSGAEPEALVPFNTKERPVEHILPSVDSICQVMEEVIAKRETFRDMALSSRRFVEQFHDHKKIAEMYLHEWKL